MAILLPRHGANLSRLAQAALAVAPRNEVHIVTSGTGQGVQLPDHAVAAVEKALGWPATPPAPEPSGAHDPEPPGSAPAETPVSEAAAPPAPAQEPAPTTAKPQARRGSTTAKKSTSSRRSARRSKE